MPAAARYADWCGGTQSRQGYPAIQGSPNVFINGLPAHRYADAWSTPHYVTASGSRTVFVNDRPLARIGDLVSTGAVIITGSPNVFAGG